MTTDPFARMLLTLLNPRHLTRLFDRMERA